MFPIFDDWPTTLAFSAAVTKPLSAATIRTLPHGDVALRGVERLSGLGILYAFDVPILREHPRVYGLNRGHKQQHALNRLGRAIWKSVSATEPTDAAGHIFVMPPSYQQPCDGGDAAAGGSLLGLIMHVLAASDTGVSKDALREIFADYGFLDHEIRRLIRTNVAVTTRAGKMISLHTENPVALAMRPWLRWLNVRLFPTLVRFSRRPLRRIQLPRPKA